MLSMGAHIGSWLTIKTPTDGNGNGVKSHDNCHDILMPKVQQRKAFYP